MGLLQVPASASACTLIQTVTATSGNSVSFSSIPGTYQHLTLLGSIATTGSGGTVDLSINGAAVMPGGAIGYIHQTGSSTISGNTGSGIATHGGSYPAVFSIFFSDYAQTSYVKGFSFSLGSVTGSYWGGFGGGRTIGTGAITSLSVSSPTIARAVFSLYGWSA